MSLVINNNDIIIKQGDQNEKFNQPLKSNFQRKEKTSSEV